jgi:hypothetical protein
MPYLTIKDRRQMEPVTPSAGATLADALQQARNQIAELEAKIKAHEDINERLLQALVARGAEADGWRILAAVRNARVWP